MKPIPEYQSVSKIYLSFVQDFYNTRFHFGKAIAQIAKSALPYAKVEIFVDKEEEKLLETELKAFGLSLYDVELNFNSPGRAIINEWAPIFCNDGNKPKALTFRWLTHHPDYNELQKLEIFSKWFVKYLKLDEVCLYFDFSTVGLSVNDGVVLFSGSYFENEDDSNFKKIETIFADKTLFLLTKKEGIQIPCLDTIFLPVKPKVWIVTQFRKGHPLDEIVFNVTNYLKSIGHTVHFVPRLEWIRYEDINTYPDYCNCILLNKAALIPAYRRKEDDIIKGILQDYGFETYSIDSRDIMLANCGPHCISKTIPTEVMENNNT